MTTNNHPSWVILVAFPEYKIQETGRGGKETDMYGPGPSRGDGVHRRHDVRQALRPPSQAHRI